MMARGKYVTVESAKIRWWLSSLLLKREPSGQPLWPNYSAAELENVEMGAKGLEMFEVGPCEDAYNMGFLIGQRFSRQIRSRLATDLILRKQLLPFAKTLKGQQLIQVLSDSNRKKFPNYWDELLGTAEGSGVTFLDILLLNFRKEILPFIPKTEEVSKEYDNINDDCSDVLVVSDSLAIAAHNEDANVALVGRT